MSTYFFNENGTGGIFNGKGQESPAYIEDKSFRLKSLTDLQKYIKNQDVQIEADIEMKNAEPKKERNLQYNVYTMEDRRRYFYFLKERLMKPKEAALAANVNYGTIRKWKKVYDNDPERKIPVKQIRHLRDQPAD